MSSTQAKDHFEMRNKENLIDFLSSNLKPVNVDVKFVSPLLIFFVFAALSVFTDIKIFGMQEPLEYFLEDPWTVIDLLLMLGIAICAGIIALSSKTPGKLTPTICYICFALCAAWITLSISHFLAIRFFEFSDYAVQVDGTPCFRGTLVFSILPAIVLGLLLRKGFLLYPQLSFLSLALSASVIGSIGVRFCCITSSPLHLLCWHILPVFLFTFVTSQLLLRTRNWLAQSKSAGKP